MRGFHDITPRMGAAYDLFGNGKTALKVSMSKYLQAPFSGEAYTINNPAVTLVSTTTRGWTDAQQRLRRRLRLHESRRPTASAWRGGT